MRIDLLVNPFPAQGTAGETAGSETGTGSPADVFLTLMAQIGAMFESAPSPCTQMMRPEQGCEPHRFVPSRAVSEEPDEAPPDPKTLMGMDTAGFMPMPVPGVPEDGRAAECTPEPEVDAEIPAAPAAPATLPELSATNGDKMRRLPQPSIVPAETRIPQAAEAGSTRPAHQASVLSVLKAFVVSEVEVPASKTLSGSARAVPLSMSPDAGGPVHAADAQPDSSAVPEEVPPQGVPREEAAASPAKWPSLAAMPKPAVQEESQDAEKPLTEAGAPGRQVISGITGRNALRVAAAENRIAVEPVLVRTESGQVPRRTPAVPIQDAPEDAAAAPQDSGDEAQIEIPVDLAAGKRAPRPALETIHRAEAARQIEGPHQAERTHQPVEAPHETGSASSPRHSPIPDGERTSHKPASPRRFDGPEVITGAHPGPDIRAVSSPRQVATSSPARNTDFIIQLAERIRAEAGNGGEGIRIQLKPANLGRVEISAESGAAGLVARIVTESGAVRQFLEGNVQILEQALQDQGLRVERIDIVMQESLDLRPSTGNQHSGQGAGHASGGPDPQSSQARGVREEDGIVLDPATLVALGPNSTFHTVA
jgi:hypothetical protein